MDVMLELKIKNVINEIDNLLSKEFLDPYNAKAFLSLAVNRLNLLLTHIAYLEEKLESTLESNKIFAEHAENLIAENQRLSQIARY